MSFFMTALALAAPGLHQAAPPAPSAARVPADVGAAADAGESEAVSAAGRWIELIDTGRLEESWRAAAPIFRTKLTAAQWREMVQAARKPFGAPVSRRLRSTAKTATLPGVPDGNYRVLAYQARFTKRAHAIETIVLSREADGWQVSGYFIR
ncbi:DUF4019 domain-containing protein [Sphingomonas mucosissima]|uniref:DUF4019 domain-containing protein n=1 Tax=Sphingomonas mucosissima TaxID=370959 RepID=A0A245ZJB1_9SPHN|nr:DUF4019 domain-containing protein [Sphingomonas mucosissima]OWK29829.1 hypothetical protein SPMU_22510 [Sphingomonas mucosissima]